MEFFDCNAGYGFDVSKRALMPVHDIGTLQAELSRAGIGRSLVYRIEGHKSGAETGNRLLAADLADQTNLFGVWSLLPSITRELPEPKVFADRMAENRIFAWRVFPNEERFNLHPLVMGDWLSIATDRRIPVFFSGTEAKDVETVLALATAFPDLRLIFSFQNVWPNDRYLQPLLANFRNVYLDLSNQFIDGAIEENVERFGSSRLLFGSGFPDAYFGHNMLQLRHCGIPAADRDCIASGNLDRLIREVKS